MHGQHPRFRPGDGGRWAPPPAQPGPAMNMNNNNNYLQNPTPQTPTFNQFFFRNPNFPIQNPNFPIQNSNFPPNHRSFLPQPQHSRPPSEAHEKIDQAVDKAPQTPFDQFFVRHPPSFQIRNPNFPIQNPNFTPHQSPNQSFRPQPQSQPQPQPQPQHSRPPRKAYEIDQAVEKARRNLITSRESVTAWKVSQSALLTLQADSWDSLGFRMQQIPSLRRLILTEGKINAFINCFVAVRRVTSLYDLELAICQNESVECFEELELGPLVRHPLVRHYFSVSSDVTEVYKITSEEIVSFIREFMDAQRGELVKAEELLNFIVKQRSVPDREKLHVRIQSLGMHISYLRKARKLEIESVEKYFDGLKRKSSGKEKKKSPRPLLSSQKDRLNDCFSAISQRVKSLSSVQEDFFGQHTTIVSSCSDVNDSEHIDNEDENDTKNRSISNQSKCSGDRLSSCPYPSEEITRLGLKGEMDSNPPSASSGLKCNESEGALGRKRKSDSFYGKISAPSRLTKRERINLDLCLDDNGLECSNQSESNETDLSLADDSMRMFVTKWKEACKEYNVAEVLDRMLQSYNLTGEHRKILKEFFSSFPFIGMFNVAVTSMKNGMWDSVYDTLQAFSQRGEENISSDKCTEYESIEAEPSEKNLMGTTKHITPSKNSVTVEDIVEKIFTYFELDQDTSDKSSTEKMFLFLGKLFECKFWLAEQFSVKEFESLGYGEFLKFVQKFASRLPSGLQMFLTVDTCKVSQLEVCIHQHQLAVLLSQASHNLWENEDITNQKISVLLMRQYPSVSFRLVERSSMIDFLDSLKANESSVILKCIIFSATLLGTCVIGDTLASNDKNLSITAQVGPEISYKAGALGYVTTKDAIDVLLGAPMLSDVGLWSHWDHIYGPSLGPLVDWLLNKVNRKELLCLVTKDGKVLRIDHSATLDSFLEAFLQGCSFQTAVQLLSLFSLYGGIRHVPLSLLRCHARRAFEVIVKNSTEIEVGCSEKFSAEGSPLCREQILDEDPSRNFSNELHRFKTRVNKTVRVASRFILDFLAYLPNEFRSFAADVLLSGFRYVIKDAHSAILSECKKTEQRLMLHEVGLSLGIVEWINDYHVFCSSTATNLLSSEISCFKTVCSDLKTASGSVEGEMIVSVLADSQSEKLSGVLHTSKTLDVPCDSFGVDRIQRVSELDKDKDAALVIESIRREEFGLDPSLLDMESSMLKKQHSRLGRALHCLSQELYSQDSHFLLELVQNADDNVYPKNVEPTLTFILQEAGIVVLNNELGFSAQNIRALCDVGNSTKKGCGSGYIGKKGIGFKSVFRVTDAPEIHSNGFHVKFDTSEGQIGFVLPTLVPPCDMDLFGRLASIETDQMTANSWKTCIVLPFRSKLSEGSAINSIISMFSDLHPSLLLFLHRLQCIKFRNMLDDTFVIMRKEIVGDGITRVSLGNEIMTWFVASQQLRSSVIRPDVQTTEISIAFTLQESDDGVYIPHLGQQPVFAFLPLRTYGLKCILQGDFVLPSSREEVDGDSPWNQWLLSQFPDLFVSVERSFCGLSCFREAPGKAVAAFMSFVPLMGEVHGFFSSLPRMIIPKLCMSNCLLLEGTNSEWVPPCKVLRNWNEQARTLLPDSLLRKHLGLGFLDKDIVLSNSLARALGIEEYGPKVLLQIMSSICSTENVLKSLGLVWLSSWLNTLYTMLFHSSAQTSLHAGIDSYLVSSLQKTPLVPLSDGTYGSVDEGTIWLHLPSDASSTGFNNENCPEAFPKLYAKLRTVSAALFSAAVDMPHSNGSEVENVTRMLERIGIQRLSAHEIVKVHILPAISDERNITEDKNALTEYLSFVMFHLQSSCPNCPTEKTYIISELYNKALILTNHGYKRPVEVPMHFNKIFGSPVDVSKLIDGMDLVWHEVDVSYLHHPINKSLAGGRIKWREFFQELGVTDFVHIVSVEKNITDIPHVDLMAMMGDSDLLSLGSTVKDWESQELVHLLSKLSCSGDRKRSQYFLEVLDTLWVDFICDKVTGYCSSSTTGDSKPFKSSFLCCLFGVPWIASSVDNELHYPKDLFYDCDAVRSILGATAPYAVPKVRSLKLLNDIGFKTEVNLNDILKALQVWRRSETPFQTSIVQMAKLYNFLWNEMATSKQKIVEALHSGPFIFVPYTCSSRHDDVVPGLFLNPVEVYWHDSTVSMDQRKEIHPHSSCGSSDRPLSAILCNIYPGLHDFFVNHCGVNENPPFSFYLYNLQHLSTVALPSQAASTVFRVFSKWADGLKSASLSAEDIVYLRECLAKLEYTVLPTVQDKWVSLHASFGLVCWCDDEMLRKEFKHLDDIDFLYFGELSDDENEILQGKVSVLMQTLGIPALSEVVTREAIYYRPAVSSFKSSLVNWALPYAQRYIYNLHPNQYSQLKRSGFGKLCQLRITVVEKLFYKNIIKRSGIASKKRFECSCLLQDNVLYTTRESNSHSVFMELSRLLFGGTTELHLANFLHMITTMAESGSTEKHTEFFILNSQKLPKLPEEEPIWSLSSIPSATENDETSQANDQTSNEQSPPKSKRKPRISTNWPPVDWKTAPGFGFARANASRAQAPQANSTLWVRTEDVSEDPVPQTDHIAQPNTDSVTTMTVHIQDSEISTGLSIDVSTVVACPTDPMFDSVAPPIPSSDGPTFSHRDQLSIGNPNPQEAALTGRTGELVAFNYFSANAGKTIVKWVNKDNETGLPYDLVMGDDENNLEYIEVKATKSARKDWFSISVREWQFAVEKNESFSVAHVLLGHNLARITVFRNPVRLSQLGKLELAVRMPNQKKENSIVS